MTALSASLLTAAFTAPAPSVASSDDTHVLTHRKTHLDHQIAGSRDDVDEISVRLVNAQGRLDAATAELDAARATLDAVRLQVAQATRRDRRMQAALVVARQRLADARADYARGRVTVARQRGDVAAYAVSSASLPFSQLSTLNLLVNADSATAAISQVQGAHSALAKQLSGLQRLQANQVLLEFTRQRIEAAAVQVADERRRAAANLAAKRDLEAQAVAAEATVELQVAALQTQQDSLAAAKRAELARIATLERERTLLEERLRRIAAAQAAAARRAAAARAAEQRAAEQRAAEQRAAEQVAAKGTSSSGQSSTSSSSSSSPAGFLSYPVTNTYITSPYGMRMHPILHVYKLHDGTDFHAPCGTPVHAAADGTVLSEYYTTGYGNQLTINHGYVHGVSLATSYNHLTSFVAHPGDHVSRGQLIAYSGTTGYSTACHLHFMVYVNAATVDPMTWL